MAANLAVLVAGRALFAVKVPLGTRLASIKRLPVAATVTYPIRHINIDFAVDRILHRHLLTLRA